MTDSRWGKPEVPPEAALLLLPHLPGCAVLEGEPERWADALARLDVRCCYDMTEAQSGPLLITSRVRQATLPGIELALVAGPTDLRAFHRAGYKTRTYVARRAVGGAIRLEPLRPWFRRYTFPVADAPRTLRQLPLAAVRQLSRSSRVTVISRGPVTPAAVASVLGTGSTAVLVTGGGGARRRSAFLATDEGGPEPRVVIKVGPAHWRERGVAEQRVLNRLAVLGEIATAVPRPLGEGVIGPLCWSAESAARGRPLSSAVRQTAVRSAILACLENLAGWLGRLGAATRTGSTWAGQWPALPLRGEYRRFVNLRNELAGVPGLLVHGDVATGVNILLDGDEFFLIDWETAAEGGPPLTDLLPLLCFSLAALRRYRDPNRAGAYVLNLCAGSEAESAWLFSLLHEYCRQVHVPLAQAGRLAALAWGYQASMRLVHEELVRQSGVSPVSWQSPADLVARRWLHHPGLGLNWSAFTERNLP